MLKVEEKLRRGISSATSRSGDALNIIIPKASIQFKSCLIKSSTKAAQMNNWLLQRPILKRRLMLDTGIDQL